MASTNLPQMHRRIAERLGPRTALCYKRDGLYHDLSWNSYRRQADHAAAGLIELGIGPGDRVGLLSENCYRWLIADIAILSAGAVNVPLHAPLAPPQVAYQIGHSGTRGVLVSGQTQTDKVLTVLEELRDLEFLVSFEPVRTDDRIRQLSWDGLIQLGQRLGKTGLRAVLRRESEITSGDLASIIYTSGTTGNPKGVMLSHGNLLSNAKAMQDLVGSKADDILLSWLPYSHIYARTVDHYLTTLSESTVCLAESVDTLIVNLRETQPTWMTSVPRFYEKVWSSVQVLPAGEQIKKLREIFGPRIRWLSSGGAPLPRHVCEEYFRAGIKLLEGYGLTESSPVISFNRENSYKIGSVGQPIPGVEVRIAEDGEILTRGPHVMQGYWKDPESTSKAIKDGWLLTGDVGTLDEDLFLTITDRKKDLIITSGGKNVAPSEIERLLTSDEYVDQAVVYGDGRHFLTALIIPDLPRLKEKADELGCSLDIIHEFVQSPKVHVFLAERIEATMQSVSRPERVRKFLVLGRPLELEAGELTATMKVRRHQIILKFEDRLAALYEED